MRRPGSRAVAIAAAATLAVSLVGTVGAVAQSPAPANDLPWSATLKDGSTFTLAPRIAEKVKAGATIEYVMSYQGPGITDFSAQYQAGFNNTLPEAQKIYPMNGVQIGPVSATGIDAAGQIAQIEALFNTDKIDCISIEPVQTNQFTGIINKLMAAGIPVFTVGITSEGNEFTNFTQVPMKEGAQAAALVLDWMKANGKDIKVFAVTGGDPGSTWGHGRMQSFYDTIMAAIPDAKFIAAPDNALVVPYDANQGYPVAKAFIDGNPDLQFIMNADVSAGTIGKAIVDAGREGQINTIGWNVSYSALDMIDRGVQVATMDQKWAEQAGFGALACAKLFKDGEILPNTQVLLPITKENAAEARAELDKILGGPPAAASAAP